MTQPLSLHKRKPLTVERLKELLRYEVKTGKFFWREKLGNRNPEKEAGCLDTAGHRRIKIDGHTYAAHHLSWLWMKWYLPSYIDHINGKRDDNRIENLRIASPAKNNANCKLRHDNTVGLKGVSRHGQRYRAQIQVGGKKVLLGIFDTPQEAHAAYVGASIIGFGEFARLA